MNIMDSPKGTKLATWDDFGHNWESVTNQSSVAALEDVHMSIK